MTPEERAETERQIAELQAKLAEPEPDWEAWRPALEAAYEAGWGDDYQVGTPLDGADMRNIRGLIAALPLAPAAVTGSAYSPAPRWVQDNIPDWAYERVAQLVGYRDTHGPRGSRAGVAFARYIAEHEAAPIHRGARWPGEGELWAMASEVYDWWVIYDGDGNVTAAFLEMARRLRAHMFGADQ